MSARASRRLNSPARQGGQALLLTVLLLAVGASAIVYKFATPARTTIEADRKTAAAMAQVREALIGWSAARVTVSTPNARPGELPCPDNNPPGTANYGFENGSCGPNAIGRVPWKTLGIPEPKDANGETLWYALSDVYRISNMSSTAINSDTAGQLTINDASGNPVASQVIAVILAPGSAIAGQVRGTAAQKSLVTNYLEGENANGGTVYVRGDTTDTFNDKVLWITSDALFAVVNVRVAKEAIIALEAYRTANDFYPFANAYGTGPPYNCSTDLTRGRFPITLTACGGADWGATLPAWFAANNWNLVTHYTLSRPCGDVTALNAVLGVLPPGLSKKVVSDLLCGLAESGLTKGNVNAINTQLQNAGLPPLLTYTSADYLFVTGVTGPEGARTLVIVTGRALGPQVHPCATDNHCMEDAANTDGNETYVKPSRYPASNDRLAVVCDSSSPCAVVP